MNSSGLQIRQGQFFTYALPDGWRVGEDGQFALTLVAPDSQAFTVMVGNAGVPMWCHPGQFVFDKLSALQPQNLQLSQPRPARPVTGFSQAMEFDFMYLARGIPYRGVAKCSVQPAYDSAVMAMTAAISAAAQWGNYATWLPQIADQVSATNGAAFGMRGLMAQNLHNSMEYAAAAQNYRDWSQRNWQQVVDERNASQDRIREGMREVLGGEQRYHDPFGVTPPVDLPVRHQYYWMDRQGHVFGTDDPSVDPNHGSTEEWRPMKKVRQ